MNRTMKLIPCFVISLSDCINRRRRISRSLSDIGLQFEFFDAVDGRNGLDEESERQIDRDASRRLEGRILSNAEFACALSHINVYRKIIADTIPYALILEDDITARPSLIDFLEDKHYQDADLTQLYSTHNRFYVRRGGLRNYQVDTHLICKSHSSLATAPVAM